MPGYLTDPASYAAGIAISASGNISAPNVQEAIYELDSEKAPATGIAQSAITNLVSDLSAKAPLASPTFTGTVSASVANISSNLTVDTDTLFVDSSNNRVGIGTTSPSQVLDVNGGIFTRAQAGGMTWGGDIDTAKWSSKLGGYTLMFGNDGTGGNAIESWTISGRTYRGYVGFNPNGSVTIPNQPAIYLDGNNSNWVTSALGATMKDFSVSFSRGGMSWDNATGRITVPVTGYYYLHFQAYHAANSTGRVFIRRNGNAQVLGHFGSVAGDHTKVVSAILSAAANDYFDVSQEAASWQLTAYRGSLHTAMYCVFLG